MHPGEAGPAHRQQTAEDGVKDEAEVQSNQ